MHRSSFSFVLLLALLAIPVNAQGQTKNTQLDLVLRPQLEPDQEGDDASEQSELDGELDDVLDDDLDDDLDSGFEEEEESIIPQRLSDDRIRANWPKHSLATIRLSFAESGRVPEDRSHLLQAFGRVGAVSDTVKVFAWEAPSIQYQP